MRDRKSMWVILGLAAIEAVGLALIFMEKLGR